MKEFDVPPASVGVSLAFGGVSLTLTADIDTSVLQCPDAGAAGGCIAESLQLSASRMAAEMMTGLVQAHGRVVQNLLLAEAEQLRGVVS